MRTAMNGPICRGLALAAVGGALASGLTAVPAAGLQEVPTPEPEIAVHGLVVHETTLAPVAGATVSIPALGLETRAGQDGSFHFVGSVEGVHQLRVSAPGHVTLVEQFEVSEEGFAYVQVLLPSLDALLGALNVRARPEGGRTVTAGEAASGSALDLLRSMPGLRMFGLTGNVGATGGGVNLRGVSSMTQSLAPQVVLDGVRIGQGDNVMDVLSQIPASHIRDIQVLPGPSAAFEHGYAANGVIRIRTRAGEP